LSRSKQKTGAGGLRPARGAPRRLKSSCR
jgi:hypothetical protein